MTYHTKAMPETPLADALSSLSRKVGSSFHTLPLSGGRSLNQSLFKARYEELFGKNCLDSEMTVSGSHFDSFFFGEKVIHEAEQLAAKLFGADGTLFVTTGTTVSNQIALDALHEQGMRTLMDKNCHQSLHFGLHGKNAEVEYLQPSWSCGQSHKKAWSLGDLLAMTLEAQASGRPYDLIILNAHSYDGVVYDIPCVIGYLLKQGVTTQSFLIDEAWGAANYFHQDLQPLTAMNVGSLVEAHPGLRVVATHSAHKSLSCLRQASMIHHRGPGELSERLKLSRFRLHTTSPSYPILASLDLARAQMQQEGEVLMARASELAARFREEVRDCLSNTGIGLNEASVASSPIPYAHADPTKVSINVSELGMSASEIRDILFSKHGIYVNRITEASLLFNFHIGIDASSVDQLLQALRDISAKTRQWPSLNCSEKFIIPYPPGVPLVVPGEPITEAIQKQIRDIQRAGVYVFYA